MYKFRAKSNIVLGVLSALALLAFIAVENKKTFQKQEWYQEKFEAAELSQQAAFQIKNNRLQKGIFVDVVNDPNQTALIGQEYTLITTDRGDIEAKLLSTNPNFAAVIVQLLKDAGLEKADHVGVGLTGSFPALNISVLTAIKTLGMKAITITSVGASNYGANDPYFTWLDMEKVLLDANIIDNKSVAASIGGNNDIGRGLSPEGRDLIKEAILRNEIQFINEKHLENSIDKRMQIYDSVSGEHPLKAYINVGGGIASLGNSINGKLIQPGLTELLPMRNFPLKGVMIQMGQRGLPVIHLLNIAQIAEEYGISDQIVPAGEPGEGGIYVQERYNMIIVIIATLILILAILFIYYKEKKQHQLGMDEVILTSSMDRQKNEKDDEAEI